MLEEKNIIDTLEREGFSRQELHLLLHKIVLREIEMKKKCHKGRLQDLTNKLMIFISSCMKQISGKALSLLRTQFAKKPKGPV